MIDGISGGGGPIRPAQGQRSGPVETNASDPARTIRRSAPTPDILTARSGRSGLVADMAKAPPIDAARVADLKARIDAGTYTVDPVRIAEAMLKLDRGRP